MLICMLKLACVHYFAILTASCLCVAVILQIFPMTRLLLFGEKQRQLANCLLRSSLVIMQRERLLRNLRAFFSVATIDISLSPMR